ncbi:Transcription factor SPEECHLESS [Raphanus sativus]|nr:Transcription factor SPEECHLESS [Raphanus sativus]
MPDFLEECEFVDTSLAEDDLFAILESLEGAGEISPTAASTPYKDGTTSSKDPRLVPSPRPSPPVLSPRKPPLSPRINHHHLLLPPISPRTPQPTSPYLAYPPQLPLIPQPPHRSYSSLAGGSSLGDPPPYSPASSSSSPSVSSNRESSVINELVANSKSASADVEVKFSGANVLLKTASHKIPGQVLKIISALEDLSLEILQVNINTVDETMLNSFTIKIGIECQLSADELAQQIQQTFC